MTNPFRNTIVTDPWNPAQTDVPEINAQAFKLCRESFEAVRSQGRSTSVLLHGEAGSGKTHLLGRLRKHLKEHSLLHVFISVRLQSSPNRFWRHVRKSCMESLLRPFKKGLSQLESIFLYRLYLLCKKKKVTVGELRQLIERLSVEADLSRNFCKALENLVRKRHRMDAIAWLKGSLLLLSSLENLGLAYEDEALNDPEYQAREFIQEICRLAGPEIPVVFCFDQVEALKRYPKDIDSLFVFGQAIGFFHDETSNVLLVSCIQSYFLEDLKQAVMSPDYDRLSVHRRTLNPLTLEQSLKLASARLQACHDLPEKKKVKASLALENELGQFVGPGVKTAREVLSRCADTFDSWEKGLQLRPRQSDEAFLNEKRMRREEHVIGDFEPERTDEIIQGALPVLMNVIDEAWKERDRNRPRDVDIVLEGPGSKVGISLCNQKNMTSLASRLKRLRGQFKDSDLDRLILIRHPHLPISPGAKKTKELLDELRGQKVRLINPDTEALASLDALRSLLADAKAGDLANGGKILGDEAVRDWVKSHLHGAAMDLMDQIIGFEVSSGDEELERFQDLLGLLDEDPVIRLDDVARRLETDLEILKTHVLRHPRKIGYLEGPPPVIFQFIPESGSVN